VRLVADEKVTTATVVPTMLDRIVTALEREPVELPTLRNLAYGGSKVGLPLVRRALDVLPKVGLVNAYGLTETSSTIAGVNARRPPHCARQHRRDRRQAARLGRPAVPGIEVQIRDEDAHVLGPGEPGELFVRGEQVSGRYTGIGSVLDEDGWFPTKDIATLDDAGYPVHHRRSDDTIIRGARTSRWPSWRMCSSSIRMCMRSPLSGWRIRSGARPSSPWWFPQRVSTRTPTSCGSTRGKFLRGSRTPDRVVFRDELPTNATGKLLRREIIDSLRDAKAEK